MYFLQWMNEEIVFLVWDTKFNVTKLCKHTGTILITFIRHIEKGSNKIMQLNSINILHKVKCLNVIQELALEFHTKRVCITPIRTKIKFIQLLFRRPISKIIEICSVTLCTKPEKGETALLVCFHFMPCSTAHYSTTEILSICHYYASHIATENNRVTNLK